MSEVPTADRSQERQAALGRLEAIAARDLDDRVLTPGEAATIIGWIGELQLYGLRAVGKPLGRSCDDPVAALALLVEACERGEANLAPYLDAGHAALRHTTPTRDETGRRVP